MWYAVFIDTLLLQLAILVPYMYMKFIYSYTQKDKKMIIFRSHVFGSLVMLNSTMLLLNPITGIVFSINSSTGEYLRGSWYFFMVAFIAFYYSMIIYLLYVNRKEVAVKEFSSFSNYMILPIFGAAIQFYINGTYALWQLTAFALVMLYMFLEDNYSKLDLLTGAFTREYLEKYLDALDDEKEIGLAFIDLDEFNRINDIYSYSEGDKVLINFCNILKKNTTNEDLIVRYNGDEFVLILNNKDLKEISNVIHAIDLDVKKYNQKSENSYMISFSCGFDVYSKEKYYNPSHLLKNIDTQMYEKKLNKKLLEYTKAQKSKLRNKTRF